MTYINRRLGGDFISAVQDSIPVQVIQSHQIAAATHPQKHTKTFADRPTPTPTPTPTRKRQALERRINDLLSEQSAKTR